MVHHICLLQTKPEVTPEKLEELMVETRIRLLKNPEVTSLRVGKRIDTEGNMYSFFYSFRQPGRAGVTCGTRYCASASSRID